MRCIDGEDHDAALGQLLQQGGRDLAGGGGHDDAVEGRGLRPALVAVAQPQLDVVQPQQPETPARGFQQLAVALDAEDAARQPGEDGGLVAGAGADFQHAVLRLQLKLLRHGGDDVGLRDGLAAGDGQGGIVPGVWLPFALHEQIARGLLHCLQHAGIADAVLAQLHDEAGDGLRVVHGMLPC